MATNEIKVFYSWQSDLPGSQTKNLIQSGIDTAVKALRNTVEIIADRDTKGVLGTPDITETIFSKIADSDIFVADISIINKYSTWVQICFKDTWSGARHRRSILFFCELYSNVNY